MQIIVGAIWSKDWCVSHI